MDVKKSWRKGLQKYAPWRSRRYGRCLKLRRIGKWEIWRCPAFKLARTLRKAPPVIAKELENSLELPETVSRACAAGGYLNFLF